MGAQVDSLNHKGESPLDHIFFYCKFVGVVNLWLGGCCVSGSSCSCYFGVHVSQNISPPHHDKMTEREKQLSKKEKKKKSKRRP